MVDRLEQATTSIKRYLSTGARVGGAAATAGAGGTGDAPSVPVAAPAAAPARVVDAAPAEDEEAWLDLVNEREHFPKIVPSHYAETTGIEPFERVDLKPWDLHTYPTGA